jgi:hypothetical protein
LLPVRTGERTLELYLRHFYDRWVGNKDSMRPKEFEAIVDTFA